MAFSFLPQLYDRLLAAYGFQGWWPLSAAMKTTAQATPAETRGYHPGDYSYPNTTAQCFEICLGAILTQNTSWIQVEKVIRELNHGKLLDPGRLEDINQAALAQAIKPAGYFNQKAKKIRIFCRFFKQTAKTAPSREELLALWGIGPETADSILLYAFHVPVFVIDAYTLRIVSRIAGVEIQSYAQAQQVFHGSFTKKSKNNRIPLFMEYHALLVEHAKRFCRKKPFCSVCHLKFSCKYGLNATDRNE